MCKILQYRFCSHADFGREEPMDRWEKCAEFTRLIAETRQDGPARLLAVEQLARHNKGNLLAILNSHKIRE
jgi:hypothetical protein